MNHYFLYLIKSSKDFLGSYHPLLLHVHCPQVLSIHFFQEKHDDIKDLTFIAFPFSISELE